MPHCGRAGPGAGWVAACPGQQPIPEAMASSAAAVPNVNSSLEYRRGLACAIILLTPLAPHFCAEMWTGLSRASTFAQENNSVDLT